MVLTINHNTSFIFQYFGFGVSQRRWVSLFIPMLAIGNGTVLSKCSHNVCHFTYHLLLSLVRIRWKHNIKVLILLVTTSIGTLFVGRHQEIMSPHWLTVGYYITGFPQKLFWCLAVVAASVVQYLIISTGLKMKLAALVRHQKWRRRSDSVSVWL